MIYFTLPLLLGAVGVFQATLNKSIAMRFGLAQAALLNSIVLTLGALALLAITKFFPTVMPSFFSTPVAAPEDAANQGQGFYWWYILPGLFGLALVSGLPYALTKLSSLQVFVIFIGSQLLISMLLDWRLHKIPMDAPRIFGIILILAGTALASLKK